MTFFSSKRSNGPSWPWLPGSAALMALFSACSIPPRPELPADIAHQAQVRIDHGYHLGTVIGIVDDDGPRYYGFGRVSPDSSAVPDEHSIFEIGSITKTFTATLLADLDLRGEMRIEGPVAAYLSAFGEISVHGDGPITLESLVTHTSGLPREPPDIDRGDDDRYAKYTAAQLEGLLASGSLEATPGAFSYSNFGFMLLEHAMETRLETTYEELVQERILSTLGMPDTSFEVTPDLRVRMTTGLRDGQPTAEVALGVFPSMGGLRSSAADMLTFLGAQIGLESSSLGPALQATQTLRFADDEQAMGLGWHILKREESGQTIHFHKGGTSGFVSFAGFDLENRRAVVVLVNGTRWFSDLGFCLLDPTYPLADPESSGRL